MKGTVEVRQVHAPSLEGNPLQDPTRRDTPIYLPPGYASGTQRYPVVYLLHGFTGSSRGWLNVSPFAPTVPERIDRLIASGAVPPFIGVFPDGWTALGGAQWMNSEATGRYRDYLVRDVVGWVDRELRTVPTAAGRALVGKSSGGYGALSIARFHPDVFGHLGCHSGDACFEYCYLPEFPRAATALHRAGGVDPWYRAFLQRCRETKMDGRDHAVIDVLAMSAAYSPRHGAPLHLELPFELETGRVREEVWARWLECDPVRFVPRHLDAYRKLGSVFIDCGLKDEFNLQWGARQLSATWKAGGVDFVHEEFDDGHMGTSYRYERSLSVLVPRLER